MELLREAYPLGGTLLHVVLLGMKNQSLESPCIKDVANPIYFSTVPCNLWDRGYRARS